MRTSAVLSAAFVGCALSSPLVKRDAVLEIDTVYDVVYTTAYVTETAGAIVPTTSAAAVETTSSASFHKQQKQWFSWAWSTAIVAATTEVITPAAPTSTSTPAPVIQSTSAVYVAPSSTSVYVAPSSTAPAVYTSSTAEKTSTTAAAAKATTYQQRVLVHHNVHRANHSANALTWSADLASTAQTIAESCVYAHDVTTNGGGYGQNIAAGVEPANISSVITDLFYNGEVNSFNGLYGQANPDMTNFHAWGHFSQIVWKDTTQVGCATVDCTSKGLANVGQYVSPFFTVCNYKSPGNYGGEYADNIGASLGRATVGWSYGL